MEYYHIRVDYLDSKLNVNQTIYEYDYTDLDKVISKFFYPYVQKIGFFFCGARLNGNEVRAVRVFKSSMSIRDCVQHAYRSLPPRSICVYSNEDLLPYDGLVDEITSDVLDEVQMDVGYDALIEKDSSSQPSLSKSNKVFIVHGHAESIISDVARTIEKLGLEDIILREQPSTGKTIIEKFESCAKDVHFAVILLTADDKIEGEDGYRARQNVIFEMGYFMGALGRKNVLCLLQENVEKPGDIDGVVYTPLDKAGSWKISLVRELQACGYSVDANNLL